MNPTSPLGPVKPHLPVAARTRSRPWQPNHVAGGEHVETIALRPGVSLVLSQIEASEACPYHHVEPEDLFGIGFHLKGGSRFGMQGARFSTQPLDVWACTSPRGADSTFVLPPQGFRTASLRFSADAARDLIDRLGRQAGPIAEVAAHADRAVKVARLAPLDPAAARTVEAMFSTRYEGATRTLFLESCALGLLAAQFDAATRWDGNATAPISHIHRKKMLAARDRLDADLADPPSIAALARSVGTNDFTLKRAFKDAFGTTVFGYVRRRRIERAAIDLHDGLSVAAAAQAAGYVCPRCFADAFRRHFGVLPSAVSRGAIVKFPANNG